MRIPKVEKEYKYIVIVNSYSEYEKSASYTPHQKIWEIYCQTHSAYSAQTGGGKRKLPTGNKIMLKFTHIFILVYAFRQIGST